MRRNVGAVLFLAAAACTSFGSGGSSAGGSDGGTGDGGTCAAPACETPGPACATFDFAGPTCPASWEPAGDLGQVGRVVVDCAAGDLHVAAKDTLDVVATYSDTTPQEAYRMRISARIAITTWDGNDALELRAGGKTVFSLRAAMPLKSPALALCAGNAACSEQRFGTAVGEWHRYTFEVASSGTKLWIDCSPTIFSTVAGASLPVQSSFELAFGSVPGLSNIDGRIDDVLVEFLPP